jgi:hypothetical protein
MKGLALKIPHRRNIWQRWTTQQTDPSYQELRSILPSILIRQFPTMRLANPMGGLDAGVELHVFPEGILVADEIDVAFRLSLGGEVLGPFPFVEEFLGEEEAVAIGFAVESGTGVSVYT